MRAYQSSCISASSQQGVMLIEALVAVVIFSIGVLAAIGLQAVALREVTEAQFRTEASYIADRVIGDMAALGGGQMAVRAGTYSAAYNATDPWAKAAMGLPGGSVVVVYTAPDMMTVTVNWQSRVGVRNFTQVARVVD